MKLKPEIVAIKDDMVAVRRDLHQNPQTAYEEIYASKTVQDCLKSWNIAFETGFAGTGVVARIEGKTKKSGKMIALRADMDALDINEKSGQPWASNIPNKMHGCGHDGHTSILLATAKYLQATKNFDGTAVLVFQPAEEGSRGADKMMEDGLFKKYPVDMIFGLHNWPWAEVGTAKLKTGALLASVHEFNIEVHGKGGHVYGTDMVDPLLPACKIVEEIQSIVNRDISAYEPALIRTTNIQGGTGAPHVVGDTVKIKGSFRCFSLEVVRTIEKRISEISEQTAICYGCKAVSSFFKVCDPTINTPEETKFAGDVLKNILGAENVDENTDLTMGGEDFGSFLKYKKGTYIFLGQGRKNTPHAFGLHSPYYDFNDEIIPIGATYFAELVERYMPAA